MKINSLTFGLCVVFFFALQAGCVTSSSQNPTVRNGTPTAHRIEQPNTHRQQTGQQSNGKSPISKEEAIAIAKEDAVKTYGSLDDSNVVACEQRTLWLVIVDGGGPEYYIDKDSGKVLLAQKLPQSLDNADVANGGTEINQVEAIAIARKDFLDSYGEQVNLFDAVACELSKAWRVFFEFRAAPGQSLATLPNADPPSYVIDKKTGKIIYRQTYN